MLKAYPGTYLVQKLEKKSSVNLGSSQVKHILFGKIVDVGAPRVHDSGGKLEPFLKAGTVIGFLNYGSDKFDEFDWEGKTYYSVIFNDARVFVE